MDSYLWYTHTIHREAQDRLHDRMQEEEHWQLVQQVRPASIRRYDRVLLVIANRLIAIGNRLKAYVRPITVSQ